MRSYVDIEARLNDRKYLARLYGDRIEIPGLKLTLKPEDFSIRRVPVFAELKTRINSSGDKTLYLRGPVELRRWFDPFYKLRAIITAFIPVLFFLLSLWRPGPAYWPWSAGFALLSALLTHVFFQIIRKPATDTYLKSGMIFLFLFLPVTYITVAVVPVVVLFASVFIIYFLIRKYLLKGALTLRFYLLTFWLVLAVMLVSTFMASLRISLEWHAASSDKGALECEIENNICNFNGIQWQPFAGWRLDELTLTDILNARKPAAIRVLPFKMAAVIDLPDRENAGLVAESPFSGVNTFAHWEKFIEENMAFLWLVLEDVYTGGSKFQGHIRIYTYFDALNVKRVQFVNITLNRGGSSLFFSMTTGENRSAGRLIQQIVSQLRSE